MKRDAVMFVRFSIQCVSTMAVGPSYIFSIIPRPLAHIPVAQCYITAYVRLDLSKESSPLPAIALSDVQCNGHPAFIQRHHVSTADVVSLEGRLAQLAIAALNQRYIVDNAGSV